MYKGTIWESFYKLYPIHKCFCIKSIQHLECGKTYIYCAIDNSYAVGDYSKNFYLKRDEFNEYFLESNISKNEIRNFKLNHLLE